MTHKYISQIRTIPNFYEDQSETAKSWRKFSYSAKSASNFIVKNKKTRVIASVLGIYMVLTSGFMVSIVGANDSLAKAANAVEVSKDISIVIKNTKTAGNKINLDLELINDSKNTIQKPFIQIRSTNNKIDWSEVVNQKNNSKSNYQSGVVVEDILAGQKSTHKITGQLTDANIKNLALTVEGVYNINQEKIQIASPRSFVTFE
jgi:hypothetical protein